MADIHCPRYNRKKTIAKLSNVLNIDNFRFSKDDLEKFNKSNILAIEKKKSTLEVLKENKGLFIK